MRLENTLHIHQQQTLKMTPQMQQSLRLLQMTSHELKEFIEEQVLINPLIDPLINRRDSFFNGAVHSAPAPAQSKDWIESTVAVECTLHDHLKHQFNSIICDSYSQSVAEKLIDLINEAGYFQGNLVDLSKEHEIPFEKLMETLSLIQQFDPVGVGAQTLGDCLRIQLIDKNLLSREMEIFLEYIPLLSSYRLDKISKMSRLSMEKCQDLLTIIRTLNPKPGEIFCQALTQIRIPDIYVAEKEGAWVAELNEEAVPAVVLNSPYYYLLQSQAKNTGEILYLKEQLSQANWLLRTLHQRAYTILRVATHLVHMQQEFFKRGPCALKPLTLKVLSMEIGLHESTISRATSGKYMSTPWGIFDFKYFLASGLCQNGASDVSSQMIQEKIKKLIAHEEKDRPLSDDELVLRLNQDGISVARRTIAKYRDALGIPSSFSRKKQNQLQGQPVTN